MNILLLGQNGVGKSTFINAFVNYLGNESLEEAITAELICLVPVRFVIKNEKNDARIVSSKSIWDGDHFDEDENEKDEITWGALSTQSCRAYNFRVGDKLVRLIDTPEISSSRDEEKVKNDMADILGFISYYKYIHGICLVFKPLTTLTPNFNFYLHHLLASLPNNATNNIVLLFTNCNSSKNISFTRSCLADAKVLSKDICFAKNNAFYLDNEVFKYILCSTQGFTYKSDQKESFRVSYETSAKACAKMLEYVATLPNQEDDEIISLNEARKMIVTLILSLDKIYVDISNHQHFIELLQKKIAKTGDDVSKLQRRLYVLHYETKIEILQEPTLVCRSCKKTCHEPCYDFNQSLNWLVTGKYNSYTLPKQCKVFEGGSCRKCGCTSIHDHIRYKSDRKKVKKQAVNVEELITTKEGLRLAKKKTLRALEKLKTELETEERKITKARKKFFDFLDTWNPIMHGNLKATAAEEALMKNRFWKGKYGVGPRTQDVKILAGDLFRLENYGCFIRDLYRALEESFRQEHSSLRDRHVSVEQKNSVFNWKP